MPKKSPETIGRKKKLSIPKLKFNRKPQSFHSLPEKKRVNSMSFKKRPQSDGKTKKKCGGKVPYYNIASDPTGYKRKKKNNKRNKTAGTKKMIVKDVGKALSTGVGVAEEMGSLGMKVGKTAVKSVEDIGMKGMKLGKKMLTMKKKKGKSTKGKSTKDSYKAYLSKRLKEVKKAHPSWPQSKVFKEAVKGLKIF